MGKKTTVIPSLPGYFALSIGFQQAGDVPQALQPVDLDPIIAWAIETNDDPLRVWVVPVAVSGLDYTEDAWVLTPSGTVEHMHSDTYPSIRDALTAKRAELAKQGKL